MRWKGGDRSELTGVEVLERAAVEEDDPWFAGDGSIGELRRHRGPIAPDGVDIRTHGTIENEFRNKFGTTTVVNKPLTQRLAAAERTRVVSCSGARCAKRGCAPGSVAERIVLGQARAATAEPPLHRQRHPHPRSSIFHELATTFSLRWRGAEDCLCDGHHLATRVADHVRDGAVHGNSSCDGWCVLLPSCSRRPTKC